MLHFVSWVTNTEPPVMQKQIQYRAYIPQNVNIDLAHWLLFVSFLRIIATNITRDKLMH